MVASPHRAPRPRREGGEPLTPRVAPAAAYDAKANRTCAIDGENASSVLLATVTAYSEGSNAWTAITSDAVARDYLAAAYDSAADLTYAFDGAASSGAITTVGALVQ